MEGRREERDKRRRKRREYGERMTGRKMGKAK